MTFGAEIIDKLNADKCGRRLRPSFRLTGVLPNVQCPFVLNALVGSEPRVMVVQRFEEIIGGRVYQIEALLVRANCWRAQIARVPGVPTALMPFYGPTPHEAAAQLRAWLIRAHRSVQPSITLTPQQP
jgi:hypothetical protein